ncbi:GNAT family acetyltransferase [Minwuia sp.]|uniref:GNAT family acetyltransferase n=1 Tax=Minwuia sp. TaxID=2493630 RepID=UPI003A91D844
MEIVEYRDIHQTRLIELWRACDLTRPWNPPEADIERAIANPSSTILLAVEDEQVTGSVVCGYDGHRGWVYYLATDPARRGSGTGRRLMREAENWLRDKGCPKIELMVRDTNEAALGFYDSLGYEHQPVVVRAKWLIEPEGGSPTATVPRRRNPPT